jgi:hypothetical protein
MARTASIVHMDLSNDPQFLNIIREMNDVAKHQSTRIIDLIELDLESMPNKTTRQNKVKQLLREIQGFLMVSKDVNIKNIYVAVYNHFCHELDEDTLDEIELFTIEPVPNTTTWFLKLPGFQVQ